MAYRSKHLASSLLSIVLFAGLGAASADPKLDSVMKTLKGSYPSTNFTSVDYTPYDGLYEVVMGKKIAYTDAKGRHFMFGHIFDMDEKIDITGERKKLLTKYDFSDLPLKHAIKITRGNGEKELAVFASPDCPYCIKLEKELINIDNITVHVLLMSRGTPGGDKTSRQVWCAEDPGKAWIDQMVHGKQPAEVKGECKGFEEAFSDVGQFARANNIMGTPYLIGKNGMSTPGMPDLVKLNKIMAPVKEKVARAGK